MSDVYLWETYDKLGREALDSGNLEQAIEAFRSAVATAEELELHDRLVLSLRNLAATMFDMNQVSDSYELLLRTLDVAGQQLGAEHSQTVETKRDLSQICQQLGYLDQADELLKAVLQEELKSQATNRIGSTLLTLAQIAQARKEPAVAAAYLQRVVKLKSQQLGEDHPEVSQALLWLSTALYQCGKGDEAQSFMRRAFGMMERQFAEEPGHLAQSLLAGAKMMVDSGQAEAALVHQKRALDILTSISAPDDPKLWETREYIATTLAALGKIEEAIEVLEYCFREGEPKGARAGATFKNLAGLYLTLGQNDKAEALYAKASAMLAETLGEEHPAYLATQEERIQLYHFSGRPREAFDIAIKTIKATERRFGAGHPNTAQAYASTALLAHGAEEWATALELMQAAEKIWMSLTPRPDDVLANCRTNLATCLIKLGRLEEAEPVLQQAEAAAGPKLAPVVAELRKELETRRTEQKSPEPTQESPGDAPTITEPPRPSLESASNIVIEEPSRPAIETVMPDEPKSESIPDDDPFSGGIDLFAGLDEEEPSPSAADDPTLKVKTVEIPEQPAIAQNSPTGELEAEPIAPAQEAEIANVPAESDSLDDPFAIDLTEPVPLPTLDEPADDFIANPFAIDESSPEPEENFETSAVSVGPEEAQETNFAAPEPESTDLFAWNQEEEDPVASSPDEESSDLFPVETEGESFPDPFASEPIEESVPEPVAAQSDDENTSDNPPLQESTAASETTEQAEILTDTTPPTPVPRQSSENEFVERRAVPRSPLSFNRFFNVSVEADSDNTEQLKSYLVDLSLGGIRINSEHPFPKESDLSISLPKGVLGQEVTLKGQVVWQKALYGASYIQGIAFKDLTPEHQNLIGQQLRPEASGRVASRQHFRLYRPFPIKLKAPGQEEWVASYATDLSVNGLGTRLQAPLEQGNPVRIRLELEFELPTVEVEAKVAWSKTGENGVSHGLQFATVGPVEARTIKRYIDRCLEFLPD